MRRLVVLACRSASGLGLCLPGTALACEPEPPPEPPPRTPAESSADFDARRERWYIGLQEAAEKASLPGRAAREDRLWATSNRVVLARIEKIGSTRLRGSEGQYYKSPLVALRAIRWLKGSPSPRRLKVHYLSDNSCDFGGAGDVPDGGEVGQVFLLFYRPGPIDPRNILYTLGEDRVVTPRSRAAFARPASR